MTHYASILQGPFHFFRPGTSDFRRLFPAAQRTLPAPHPIYPTDESSTPFHGFPLLISPPLESLEEALATYVHTETARLAQGTPPAHGTRSPADRAWEEYADRLGRITVDATSSSYGRQHLSVFWLFHSRAIAEIFEALPTPSENDDRDGSRRTHPALRYRLLQRYLSSVEALTRAAVASVGERLEEASAELYPTLLKRISANVLVVTETRIDPDLEALDRYLAGYRGVDPADFRLRLQRLRIWHRSQLSINPELQRVAQHLLAEPPGGGDKYAEADRRLLHPGYVAYLSAMEIYDQHELLSAAQVGIWDDLVDRLKEFEILTAWRRLIVPVRREKGQLLVSDRFAGDTEDGPLAEGGGQAESGPLAASTHALDFSSSSIVDPIVHRYGLVYDMTRFAETVAVLGRLRQDDQEISFRSIFEFQRWANRLAAGRRVHLEKYLGDGAFYSARDAGPLLAVAIRLQRRYAALVDQGFPLDHGIRMALNFGSYRLIPLHTGGRGGSQRFEFLGQGIVELTRLITGKPVYDPQEIRAVLADGGCDGAEIDRILAVALSAPVGHEADGERACRFSARVDTNGHLTNEGIVATTEFIDRLGRYHPHSVVEHHDRTWALIEVLDDTKTLRIAIRPLGRARLKGLEEMEVYQLLDAENWAQPAGNRPARDTLLESLTDALARPSRPADS